MEAAIALTQLNLALAKFVSPTVVFAHTGRAKMIIHCVNNRSRKTPQSANNVGRSRHRAHCRKTYVIEALHLRGISATELVAKPLNLVGVV